MHSFQYDFNLWNGNIKDTKNIFSQNVLYNMLDDFMQKIVKKKKKKTLAGFSQRGSHIVCSLKYLLLFFMVNLWLNKE